MKSKNGLSIVELTIAIGILSVTALAFGSMINNQNRQTKALGEKMSALDLTNMMLRVVSIVDTCTFNMTNPSKTFDSTAIGTGTPPTIAFATMYSTPSATGPVAAQVGQPASSLSASAVVKSIVLDDINGSGDTFSGKFSVDFDEAFLTQAIRPVRVGVSFFTNPASPANAKVITSCVPDVSTSAGTPEIIWSGNVGGGGVRTYGIQTLMPGRSFADYKYIFILGWSNNAVENVLVGFHGKVHAMIPVLPFSTIPRMFDTQTFSGDDSGTTGIRYLSPTSFQWGTSRAARLNQIWGIP